ncbi:MAG: TolC family protein [Pirellulaceae bacterium]|nr:TolC family protein [Pirellulaceae bacterium]
MLDIKIKITIAAVVFSCGWIHSPSGCSPGKSADAAETPQVELAEDQATVEGRSIAGYVELGLAANPAISEAHFKVVAARHRIPQQQSLPDPMVNTKTFLSPVQTAAGEQRFALGVSQKFTNSKRRRTKAAIASAEVSAAMAEFQRVQLEITEKIRIACYQLLFVQKAAEITAEDIETLSQISQIIQRQYEVKQSVTQQDVLNVETEISRVKNQLTVLRQKEKSYRGRLARLLHLPPQTDLQITDSLTAVPVEHSLQELTDKAIQFRPELAGQLANISRDRHKICLANLQRKPDFTVGLNWISTSSSGLSPVANGEDAVLLGIGFNLPVYRRRITAAVGEAKAATLASSSRYESLEDQVGEEVFDLIARAESSQATLEMMQQDIIPNAARTLELSIEEYVNGDIKYVQLIDNWRALLRYRLAEAQMIADYNQIAASLERSVGGIVP